MSVESDSMKAILINPERREVTGIEVQPNKISAAFGSRKVFLASKTIGRSHVLYYDAMQSNTIAKSFWIEGVQSIIFGKAFLLGREAGLKLTSSTLSARDVECLVRFTSSP